MRFVGKQMHMILRFCLQEKHCYLVHYLSCHSFYKNTYYRGFKAVFTQARFYLI